MRYFRLKLILLFITALLAMIAFAMVFGKANFLFTQMVLLSAIALIVWQIMELIESTNRRLSKFLFALQYNDFSTAFPEVKNNSFRELHLALNRSLKQIEKKNESQNENHLLSKFVLERMPVGLIVVGSDNKVELINEKASDFLDIASLRSLSELDRLQGNMLSQLNKSELEQAQKIVLEGGKELLLYKMEFKVERQLQIFFLQSIEELKDDIEIEAWMNLIRVLIHEMVNSVSSISSLAKTLNKDEQLKRSLPDVNTAIQSIDRQAENLLSFTESYAEVNSIKKPNKEWFLLSELILHLQDFLKSELKNISIKVINDKEQSIYADQQQLSQVLINLFLNARTALNQSGKPEIKIKIWQELKKSYLTFTDNGMGISPRNQNQIFVPFFSTTRDGQGIGLTLCRQLMRNNSGSISLEHSSVGNTSFKLTFKL